MFCLQIWAAIIANNLCSFDFFCLFVRYSLLLMVFVLAARPGVCSSSPRSQEVNPSSVWYASYFYNLWPEGVSAQSYFAPFVFDDWLEFVESFLEFLQSRSTCLEWRPLWTRTVIPRSRGVQWHNGNSPLVLWQAVQAWCFGQEHPWEMGKGSRHWGEKHTVGWNQVRHTS